MARLAKGAALMLLRWRVNPPAMLALIYLVFTLLGAAVLSLPISHVDGIGLYDALFTAVSAVTVTGLVVVDTGSAFTPFGQGVIAALIQLGGLGLMTFAALLLSMLGLSIGLPQQLVLRDELNQNTISNLSALVRLVATTAVICEGIGALILAFVFVPEFGWAGGIWQAVFHSISAFNNAGFSLFPDSLTRYVADPLINLVIPALFITGGLGFIVLADLYQRRQWRKLSLHSKLMLTVTGALILLGWIGFAALEWHNPATLGRLDGTLARIWASWFQAVTPRTAGFNSLDYAAMEDSTALFTMLLMVVGGGPTSTAGGIKVTTLIVLLLATLAFFRRRSTLHAFGRSLGVDEVMKVMALTVVSVLVIFGGLFAVTLTHQGDFLDLAFEVTSAFGTVGLSRGATGELDGFGRFVLMAIMFTGRVGPLTIGFFLATRSSPRVRYPEGQVFLG